MGGNIKLTMAPSNSIIPTFNGHRIVFHFSLVKHHWKKGNNNSILCQLFVRKKRRGKKKNNLISQVALFSFLFLGSKRHENALVDPPNVSSGAIALQKHIDRPPVRRHLGLVEDERDVAGDLGGGVPASAVVVVGGHEGVVVDAGQGGRPLNVAGGQDARVEVAVHEDGAVGVVPGTAEGALAHNLGLGGPVVGDDLGRVNVHAVLVGKGRVGALPGGDAAAAVAQREGRLGYVERAEAVEEVGLAGDHHVVKVGVA